MNPIEQDLRQFVIETFLFGNDDGQLSNDDSFIDRGLIDSMGILNLVSYVEKEYGIKVADTELVPEIWDSVSRIARFIASKETVEISQAYTVCAS
jgi:acyl carrier protein